MPASFVDSNILLYLLSDDERKRGVAKQVLAVEMTISVQVLNEIAAVARRKHRLAWAAIGEFIDDLLPLVVVRPLTLDTHHAGRRIAARYGFGLYDSMIVAAAIEAGCTRLLSEDLQHGQQVGELAIVNPFVSGDAPR